MIRFLAWAGQRFGEGIWWLLHEFFKIDPPDFDGDGWR